MSNEPFHWDVDISGNNCWSVWNGEEIEIEWQFGFWRSLLCPLCRSHWILLETAMRYLSCLYGAWSSFLDRLNVTWCTDMYVDLAQQGPRRCTRMRFVCDHSPALWDKDVRNSNGETVSWVLATQSRISRDYSVALAGGSIPSYCITFFVLWLTFGAEGCSYNLSINYTSIIQLQV